MFNNVNTIQFDNLPNPEEACQYVNINRPEYRHVAGRWGGGVAIGVDPFLSTVLFPIITYWENNKVTPPDFTDSMQKFYVYDFIIISIKIQIFEMRELPPPRIRNLKYVLTVCVLNLSCFTLRCLGWSALPPPPPLQTNTLSNFQKRCYMLGITV